MTATDEATAPPPTAPEPAPASQAEPAPVGVERRLVSVLFVDLVGFTTLAEGRDPEEVRDLLGQYFIATHEVIERFGGVVEKFIGDAVMAVWGTPQTHEDDAERAVRAALAVIDTVHSLGDNLGLIGLDARAGVLTGEAAVTLGATDQGMVAGDLVNTASRLQSAAAPGTVLVGAETMAAAAPAVLFTEAGSAALKGKASPVPAWRAERVVGEVGGQGRRESLESAFVGRDTEFRLVQATLHAMQRDRRARLISLTGQAGIGKTRLGWEFEKYVDGLASTIWWHYGRSPARGAGGAYWALGQMMRARVGLEESADAASVRAAVGTWLDEQVTDPGERAIVEPAVLTLFGTSEGGPAGRESLFTGWRLLLERLAAEAPVVLLFEDAQWADDGLLDFVEHLLEWSRNYPILVMTLARTELLDRRTHWGAQPTAVSLPLGPLDDVSMQRLLDSLTNGIPDVARTAVLDRADGVPLFGVEMIRTLLAQGRLSSSHAEGTEEVREAGSFDVPSSLRGLISARLDALPLPSRRLVADASTLGKTFTVPSLLAVTQVDQAVVPTLLRDLDRLEIIALDTDPRSPQRGQYTFVQSLVREVAYSTLSRRDRRAKHLAAAAHIDSLGTQNRAEESAAHLLAAWGPTLSADSSGSLAIQARAALIAAGEKALKLSAVPQAFEYFEQAQSLPGADPATQADLLERSGRAAALVGRHSIAEARYADAVTLRRALDDADGLATAMAGLIESLTRQQRLGEAATLATAAVEETATASGRGRLRLLTSVAGARVQASPEEVLIAADGGARLAEQLGDRDGSIEVLRLRAMALMATGRMFEASALLDGLVTAARAAGHPAQSLRIQRNRASVESFMDPRSALEGSREVISEARRYGMLSQYAGGVNDAAVAALALGEWAWAREQLTELLTHELSEFERLITVSQVYFFDLFTGEQDPGIAAQVTEVLAGPDDGQFASFKAEFHQLAAWAAGDFDTVIALNLDVAAHDYLNRFEAMKNAHQAAALKGDAGQARQLFDQLTLVRVPGPRPFAVCAGAAAKTLALEGQSTLAEEQARAAIAELSAIGCRFDVAEVALDLALILGPEHAFGQEMAQVARPILQELSARPFLVRLADRFGEPGPG